MDKNQELKSIVERLEENIEEAIALLSEEDLEEGEAEFQIRRLQDELLALLPEEAYV